MKKALFLMTLMVSVSVFSQKPEPTFENEGKLLKATYFHDNGEVSQTGYFLNGKLHGDWVMFDAGGTKIATGTYENGIKTGKWFFWKMDNLSEVDYAANRIVQVKEWNKTGLVSTQN